MSTANPASEKPATAKPQRVLACVLCQQRKVKCDRRFPCANCVRTSAQCVPSSLVPRQRRRRFPERELLERLRHYEGLLRQNNVKFEPMHTPAPEHAPSPPSARGSDCEDDPHSEQQTSKTEKLSREKTAVRYKPVDLYRVMRQRVRPSLTGSSGTANKSRKSQDTEDDDRDSDGDDDGSSFLHGNHDPRDGAVKKAWWDHMYESEKNDHLLFGSPKTDIDLSTLHPEQVQIFRLWQIYLENVNPLLKVTQTPTLQARIIDAAGDVASISPTLEALIFSIYCVSILSLTEDDCLKLFGTPRRDLLMRYQFGCQQALLNCEVLRSGDRDCLIALFLYLISVRPKTDPRSLASVLAVAIRTANRMGLHDESANAKCPALEAEMRRRLWWSLIIFDNRICELIDYKTATLVPTWDCKTPLNVNDFEIRPEMKTAPAPHEEPTEALFVVVRSELADFARHSAFHLDFINPSLKAVAINSHHDLVSEAGELGALERIMEDKYLASCNPENPLHAMTIWTTRCSLAKARLLDHYSKPLSQQTDTQRGSALSHALTMLDCDTKLLTSPLTKGYLWLVSFHFPFPAYIYILQDLKKRPAEDYAEKAWDVMSDNYAARIVMVGRENGKFILPLSRLVLQAWAAREALLRQEEKPMEPPHIVSDLRIRVPYLTPGSSGENNVAQPSGTVGVNTDHMPMLSSTGPAESLWYDTPTEGSGSKDYNVIPGQGTTDVDIDQFDWTTIDWTAMHSRGW